ncbi:hypothetical protein [Gordonia sp. N1V]|uniref:hypothetical protein n=1 Tax=Gordonia sp. N1V TaxID=3034163 RepID=UPI0023E12454|nr:hypothetical protein [Gordonia sp. N1V]MDF3285011.1 hypothetical protein [Gordonia sp. N1V]
MTVMDHPARPTPPEPAALVEVETVDAHGRLPGEDSSYPQALDDDHTHTILAEREFLTALLWAPPAITTAVLHAIIGTPSERTNRQPPVDVLPDPAALLLDPTHQTVLAAITTMVDEGQPVTPALILARLDTTVTSRRHRHLHRALLLEVTAPAGYSHPHHGAVLPHLATTLVESWYRRGYARLAQGMRHAAAALPTHELAAWRDDLITMSHTADTRMLAITDRLARI